ncbi:phosphoglycolate phosphatase [Solimonas soli]|uniref:phosphoglycolate phosphatase n=1 Tax=Solimonas soli TaxID=413479 RepID=UPI0004ADC0AA|nr:phosphoglycolate phosphatase [Solimonas soli]
MFEDRASAAKTRGRPGSGPTVRRIPRPPRALLFDLDGTLVDSLGDLHACLNRLLAGRGLAPLGREQVRRFVGDGVRALVRRGLTAAGAAPDKATLDTACNSFMADYLAAPAIHTRPYPGVPETLAAFHAEGRRLAVCTNKPEAISVAILEALGLAPLFSAVIGGDSTAARKPDPLPLQAALAALGVAAADAVMIGDGLHDAEAAATAGMAFVGVDYGYGADGLATLTPAPRLLRRFADLREALSGKDS